MARYVKIGDSFALGPVYAELTDGTVLDLTGAHIEAQAVPVTGGAAVITKKNAAMPGGSASQVEVTNATTGEIFVYIETGDTATLVDGMTYHMDVRVRTAGGKVYTVGDAEFTMQAAHTEVPAP